jgi:O-antigen ligase
MIENLKNYKALYLSSLLIIFLPVFLITGPFLSDLSVVIIILIFIFNIIKESKINILNNIYIKFFLIFYLMILLSSILSEYFFYSIKPSFTYLRFGLFAIATSVIFSIKTDNIKYLSKIFIIIFFILTIDSLTQYVFEYNLLGWKVEDSNFRITSLFGDDEILGSYIARLFPFFISILLYSKEKLNFNFSNNLFYFIFPCALLVTYISGERTSFFLNCISIIIMLFACASLRKVISLTMISMVILLGILTIFDKRIKNRMIDVTVKQLGLSTSSERLVVFSDTYEGHYKISLNMFKEKPFFGHGIKTFRKYCAKQENYVSDNACTTHPHNLYFQLLAEAGVFSFLFILFIFLFLTYKLIKISFMSLIKKDHFKDYKTLIYIFYAVNLFPFAPSGNFFNNWLSIIYYLPSGYLIFLNNNKND